MTMLSITVTTTWRHTPMTIDMVEMMTLPHVMYRHTTYHGKVELYTALAMFSKNYRHYTLVTHLVRPR